MKCAQGPAGKGLGSGYPTPGLRTCSRNISNIWGALNDTDSWAIAASTPSPDQLGAANTRPFTDTGSELQV